MSLDKDVLLNIRDLVIEFRSKGKKFNAVKGVSFDIYRKEIFGLVGESGSGKTTIGRAIVGVQPLKDGAIYMDDNIVAGHPTSLYILNKEISKKLDLMSHRMEATSKEIQTRMDELKKFYLDFLKDPKELSKNNLDLFTKSLCIDKLELVILKNLKFINTIIKNEDRMIKFIDNINSYVAAASKELEISILSKLKETKKTIIDIKENADTMYLTIKQMVEYKDSLQKLNVNQVKEIVKTFLEMWRIITNNHKEFLSKLQWAQSMQKQLHALSCPLKKREKFINYYNKLIYVSREEFFKECQKQLQIKNKQNEDVNSNEYKELIHIMKNFWSSKSINLNCATKILKELLDNKVITLKAKELTKHLKDTDLENEIINLVNNDNELNINKVNELFKELNYVKKIVKKNFVKDRNAINAYYKWKNISSPYSEEEINSFIELLNFLELPSIDEIIRKSYLFKVQSKEQKKLNRKNIQMIFQDPGSSLNDRMAIEEIVAEGIENFPEIYKSKEAKELYVQEYNLNNSENKISIEKATPEKVKKHIILKLINKVGLLPEHLSRYPHEFSGGQRQRVGIARSLAMQPKVIVADEPISALDVSIRAQVLNLFKKFKEELGITYIFVAHDLSVVHHIADRIAVIYHGQIVEIAPAEELFKNPLHPYTKSLLSAIPIPEPDLAKENKLVVYDPEQEHKDYIFDLPYFKEITKDHFVWANKREIKEIRTKLNLK